MEFRRVLFRSTASACSNACATPERCPPPSCSRPSGASKRPSRRYTSWVLTGTSIARNLGPALRASRPLFHDTTPVIADQLRPFTVAVQPLARTLAPASAQLGRTIPALSRTVGVLNALFNTLAYQPRGGEQGYLFWGSWLAHIADSLTASQDANGPVL